jgi:hypothetical protein
MDREGKAPTGRTESAVERLFVSTWKYSGYVCSDLCQIAEAGNLP